MENKIITLSEETYSRAQLIKGRLEANGITCFLSNVNAIRSDIPQGVKIMINESDADEAKKILEQIKKDFGQEKEETIKKLRTVRRILVPVDFSEHAKNACLYALGIAEVLKAEVRLLHIYYSPTIDTTHYSEAYNMHINVEKYIHDIYKNARYDMNKLHTELRKYMRNNGFKHATIDSRLLNGGPEAAILDECKEYDPALVVMGYRGKGEDENIALGSVTSHVIRKTKRPVLAVPEKAIFKGVSDMNNIAYATNFDNYDFNAIMELMNLVKPFHMKIHCIHVKTEQDEYWDEIKLKGLKEYFAEQGLPYIECKTIKNKDLITGLQEFVKDHNIHIMAITHRKRNFLSQLINPGMTQEILQNLDIPILVFHS
ncbi:MAG: universal stress protein [Bacteroidales bacterium]|nr:universal stress protein [Bacteroidales bacterium]MCF8334951.1 universal stress protein [Bacteroidales bacterium]